LKEIEEEHALLEASKFSSGVEENYVERRETPLPPEIIPNVVDTQTKYQGSRSKSNLIYKDVVKK
jgi:hypothetical protein